MKYVKVNAKKKMDIESLSSDASDASYEIINILQDEIENHMDKINKIAMYLKPLKSKEAVTLKKDIKKVSSSFYAFRKALYMLEDG